MNNNCIKKGEWVQTDAGQVYVAKAVTDKNRVLGVVRVEVPVESGFDFATLYGTQLDEQMIVDFADDLVGRMVEGASQKP